MAPLVQRTFGQLAAPAGLSADLVQNYQDYQQSLLQAGQSFNLLSLLAINYPGLPSLMAGRDGMGLVMDLASASTALGLLVIILLAGIWLSALYYAVVGRVVVGGGGLGDLWVRSWRIWLRLLGFLVLAVAALMILGTPLLAVVFLIGSLSGDSLSLVASFAWVAAMWLQFYLFFVVDAMVISDAGPLKAIRNSLLVVRFNLGSSLGLVVVIWIIMLGMPVVWSAMAANPISAAVAILGNAYISTGLAVASMLFYRERFTAISSRVRVG
jgi:hypothetical protein